MPQHHALHRYSPARKWSTDAYMLARHQQPRIEEVVRPAVVHPVDEVLLVASEIDGGDFSRLKARTGRQHASHIQIKVRGCVRGRIYVGDQAARVEPVLREDSHRVRKESRRGAVQCPGDFHHGRRSQIVDGLAAFPFGLTIHVHRELVAVRPLNDEGITAGVHTRDTGDEIINIGVGVAWGDGFQIQHRGDRAGDLSAAVDSDRLAKVEFKLQTDDVSRAHDQRSRQGNRHA